MMTKFIKIILLALVFPVVVFCNLTGSEIVTGNVTFTEADNALTINQQTDRAIINLDFSIGVGETTNFVQPRSSSAVLNRVVGENVSEIYGPLSCNGSVYLFNYCALKPTFMEDVKKLQNLFLKF